ncbi:MAG: tRNA (adenosine(37)-N6)-dimethylallyltransferase MiaA [Dehalococcoidia bacterium]
MPRKLIAIVGPTASGKTGLAMDISARTPGRTFEAVNADSRQVYRFMDIGTAKPTAEEQARLPHHLIDIADPDQPFSVGAWLDLARETLESIWHRGQIPLVVGGTGQYVWALLEGWRVPRVPPQLELRKELENKPPEQLLADLKRIDPEAHSTIEPRNVRRVIRALEVYYATGKPFSHWRLKDPPLFDWTAIGIRLERQGLYQRIDERVDAMMANGFLEEVRLLRERGCARDLPSMSSIGYGEVTAHLVGEITLEEAKARTKLGSHRLARHQNAWFKSADDRIHWIEPGDSRQAVSLVEEFLVS